jgi:hypothetical protein
MKGTIKGAARLASSLAVAGGLLVAAALPAAASSPNRSYGARATGLISISPVAQATFPGTSPRSVAHIAVTGLLTSGVVTDTAGPTSASSTIANAAVTLTGTARLTASAVTSSCTFNTNTGRVSGTAGITNGVVRLAGVIFTHLAANPAPNTTITVPGVATITLNRQTTAGDGTLTVSAISITLLGSTQTLTLATSVCNAANLAPVPILPGKSLEITLGGLGALLLGGVGYQMSRRRKLATAA